MTCNVLKLQRALCLAVFTMKMLRELSVAVGVADIVYIVIVMILKRKTGMTAGCIDTLKITH